jgi:ABC-2 type transport system ATP-binding protein
MADRIGVITHGELILVEEKNELMRKLGKKQLTLLLQQPLTHMPPELVSRGLALSSDGSELDLHLRYARRPRWCGRTPQGSG